MRRRIPSRRPKTRSELRTPPQVGCPATYTRLAQAGLVVPLPPGVQVDTLPPETYLQEHPGQEQIVEAFAQLTEEERGIILLPAMIVQFFNLPKEYKTGASFLEWVAGELDRLPDPELEYLWLAVARARDLARLIEERTGAAVIDWHENCLLKLGILA